MYHWYEFETNNSIYNRKYSYQLLITEKCFLLNDKKIEPRIGLDIVLDFIFQDQNQTSDKRWSELVIVSNSFFVEGS